MKIGDGLQPDNPLGALRQFVRRKRPAESCELCSQGLGPEHPHLLEIANRKLLCACDGCALLFCSQTNSRYKRVPRRVQRLKNFQMSDAQWEDLRIPINMAFFLRSSLTSTMTALYPSPAGTTESLLTMGDWTDIVQKNPVLNEMDSDVEALLVNRIAYAQAAGEPDYYIAPVDECYRLTGLIRLHWHGLSGGTEVWREIASFFDALSSKAIVIGAESYA